MEADKPTYYPNQASELAPLIERAGEEEER